MAFNKPYEPKPNSGSIFNNERKESDKHPDRTGQGVLECPHCGKSWQTWISGWLKESKDGKKYLSLAFQKKEDKNAGGGRRDDRGGNDRRDDRRDDDRGGGRRAGPDTRGSYRDKDDNSDIPF